jgi:hypothetical protein
MILKTLRKFSLVIIFAASGLAHAKSKSDIAYSQNNPPLQSKVKGYISKDHPILVNADLLIGLVQGSPTNYAQRVEVVGDETTINTYKFNDRVRAGFRVGLGVGLNNVANLSAQWTRITNNEAETREFAAGASTQTINVQMPAFVGAVGTTVSNSASKIASFQKQKYQTADVLVQTASWMMNSNFRFQPFGGFRYLEYTRKLSSRVTNLSDDRFASAESNFRIRATGVLVGTDLKYLFAKDWHFFSNLTAAIVGGYHRRNYQAITSLDEEAENPSIYRFREKYSLSFDPMLEFRLGLAWETKINDQWMLSLRISYELASLIHTGAAAINPPGTLGTAAPVFPLRTNDVIKTQMFLIGFTVGF